MTGTTVNDFIPTTTSTETASPVIDMETAKNVGIGLAIGAAVAGSITFFITKHVEEKKYADYVPPKSSTKKGDEEYKVPTEDEIKAGKDAAKEAVNNAASK